jgi:hypothetical protein
MITVLTPAPTQDLITLSLVKAELGIAEADTEDDEILEGMITRASSAIALECGRVFGAERVAETLQGARSSLLRLTRYPIVELEEILDESVAMIDFILEDAELGAVWRQQGWGYGSYLGWDSVAYTSGYILPGSATYRYIATYTGGYLLPDVDPSYLDTTETIPPLPGALQEATLETVKGWFNEREGGQSSVGSVRLGNLAISYGAQRSQSGALPSSIMGTLRHFRAVL